MVNKKDFRFDYNEFKPLIGKKLNKYRSDPFIFKNSVCAIIGFYIEGKYYRLYNEYKNFEYYGDYDDYAMWKFEECKQNDIKSYFSNTIQYDTPVNEVIKKIVLVNEKQTVTIDNTQYEVWITRDIIIYTDNKEFLFEKDTTPFSQEIFILKGHNLIEQRTKTNSFFMDAWDDNIRPYIDYELIAID